MRWVVGVAAAIVLIAGSLAFAMEQHQQAVRVSADAASYNSLLSTLGGKEFRLGN
jgi:hypothetical protein